MKVTDPIADMLTRIRNALMANHEAVDMPHSKLKTEIARILKGEGYVTDYVVEGGGAKKTLRVYLKYVREGEPAIRGLKKVSTPGCRRYVGAGELPRVLGGLGVAIISTSAGVVTDKDARKTRMGGEVLCHVW